MFSDRRILNPQKVQLPGNVFRLADLKSPASEIGRKCFQTGGSSTPASAIAMKGFQTGGPEFSGRSVLKLRFCKKNMQLPLKIPISKLKFVKDIYNNNERNATKKDLKKQSGMKRKNK